MGIIIVCIVITTLISLIGGFCKKVVKSISLDIMSDDDEETEDYVSVSRQISSFEKKEYHYPTLEEVVEQELQSAD